MVNEKASAIELIDIAEKMFQAARDDYRLYTIEMRNRQTMIQNIYFWIASALFTVYAAAFKGVFFSGEYLHIGFLSRCIPVEIAVIVQQVTAAGAFVLCAIVMLAGVNAMRGHRDSRLMFGPYSPHAMLKGYVNTTASYTEIMLDLLDLCRHSAAENRKECDRVGKHLRMCSKILVAAIALGLLSFVF